MSEWVPIAAIIISVVAIALVFLIRHEEPTAENVSGAFGRVKPLADELATVANTIVQANEQRKREGKLTNDAAYDIALDYVRNWFGPLKVSITNEQIIAAINSAILVASAATAQIEAAKAAKPIPAAKPYVPPSSGAPASGAATVGITGLR